MSLLGLRLIGGALGLAALGLLVWRVMDWRADAAELPKVRAEYAQYQSDVEAQRRRDREQAQKDADLAREASSDLAELRAERDRLLAAARTAPLVETREVARDTGQNTCPATVRTDAFRLCFNAAFAGDAAAIAACEARGMPDPAGRRAVPAAAVVQPGDRG